MRARKIEKPAAAAKAAKVSRTKKPPEMTVEQWQRTLRREFGAAQNFTLKNLGADPFFSEFEVGNPETGGKYRVAIRSEEGPDNYCSCPDFAVNTLGTCKHIEFALSRLKEKKGFKEAMQAGPRNEYSSVFLRYGGERKVGFKPGAGCQRSLLEIAALYFGKDRFLTPAGFMRFDEFAKEASRIDREVRYYEDALAYIAEVRDRENLKRSVDLAFPKGADDPALGRLLKTALLPYQRKGALAAARAGRFIIADEMGLGKTVQAIAACEILARHAGVSRVLIVCPASLKHQWRDEIEKFTGKKALVVEGPTYERHTIYSADAFYKLLNYDLVHRDFDAIVKMSPDVIVLDEAQRIKNWKTRLAQTVKKLESPHAIVLTGTPLENRLEELHSIVEFVDRFHLGPRFRFLHDHQITDEAGMVTGYRDLNRIAETLAPILIRRSKSEVMSQLPPRTEKKIFVPMTPEQMRHHDGNKETVALLVAKWRRYHFLSDADQRRLMSALQFMRMVCNSTFLVDGETDFGTKADELMTVLEELFADPEAKAVVFSQWLGTHELISRRLKKYKWDHAFLHGGVPSPKRKDLVCRFKDDPKCRLFLATEAGGVGMNLQNASAVVNMDLPWNPAVLDQRIGRVHRMGQSRPVQVFNFIAEGTIEHGMLQLLGFKKSLFSGILDGGQDEVFLGGSRLKRFMESVETATSSVPLVTPPPAEPPAPARESVPPQAAPAPDWSAVASAGLSFLDQLGRVMGAGPAASASAADMPRPSVERDEAGRTFVKFPVPPPDVLRKVADLLYQLSGK